MFPFIITEPGEFVFRFETLEKAAGFLWSELCGEHVTVVHLGEGTCAENVTAQAIDEAKHQWATYHGNDRDYGDYPDEPAIFKLTKLDAEDLLRDVWRGAAGERDYVLEVSSPELSGRV